MKMMRNLDAIKKMNKDDFLKWFKENIEYKDRRDGSFRIIFNEKAHAFFDIEFPIFYIYEEFRTRDEFKEIQEKFTEKQIAEYESLQKKMSVEFYCFGVDYIDPYDSIEELDQFDYDDFNDMVINFYYKHQDDIRDNVLYDNKDRIVENLKTYLRHVNDYKTPKKIESVQELNDVRKMSEKEFANWFNENFRYYIVSEGCRINYKGDKNDRKEFYINYSEWCVYKEFKKSSEYKEFENRFSKERIEAYEKMIETVGDNIKEDNPYTSHVEDESLLEMTLATGIFLRNNEETVTNSILYKEREYIVEKLKEIRLGLCNGLDVSTEKKQNNIKKMVR